MSTRHGLVADCQLIGDMGNVTSYQRVCGDNDGLHTAEYIASQCWRYAVTKDPEVKAALRPHFEALHMLHNITGIPAHGHMYYLYPCHKFASPLQFYIDDTGMGARGVGWGACRYSRFLRALFFQLGSRGHLRSAGWPLVQFHHHARVDIQGGHIQR